MIVPLALLAESSLDGAALAVSIAAVALALAAMYDARRTQKLALINSITNDARIVLVDAVRAFHEWCGEISITVQTMGIDDKTSLGLTANHHVDRVQRIEKLTWDDRALTIFKRLEEYEPLFSETRIVRVELLKTSEALKETARQLASQHAPGESPVESRLRAFRADSMDLMALTWDLLIFIQNSSLGRVTGKPVAERVPLDPTVPRLVVGADGCLRIHGPDASR